MPDALEVCRNLSRCHELYIVSNGVSSTQFKRLEESGLRPFMKQVFVSEDVGYQKPMKEYFDYVERHISGFDRKNALMIGDSPVSYTHLDVYKRQRRIRAGYIRRRRH